MTPARRLAALVLFVVSCGFPAWAVPGEVTGVGFQSRQAFAWTTMPGAVGYHVYRSTVAEIRLGDYGDCLLGSVRGSSASDTTNPASGAVFTYLVAAFDESGQGTLGMATSGLPRTPALACIPARRFFALQKNGQAADGVEDGTEPRRNPDAAVWVGSRETTGVYLHTGEFFVSAGDVSRSARQDEAARPRTGELRDSVVDWIDSGPIAPIAVPNLLDSRRSANEGSDVEATRLHHQDLVFDRSYRSQVSYDGPMGHSWDFGANARLGPLGADVVLFDGTGRCDPFFRLDSTQFTSPPGIYAVLKENTDGSFTLRQPDGTRHTFHAFDGSNREGAIERIEDRNARRTSFLYDHQGLLTMLVDTLGRAITYAYDGNGRITSITDFAGRSVVFGYDANGDLVSVRSPLVTGTPHGNDFPSGKTTTYAYSSGFADARLNHNLLSIRPPSEHPSGPPTVQIAYATTGAAFNLDRVVSQTVGGTNDSGVPAGGTLGYTFTALNPGGNPSDLALPRRRAIVVDRNGNQREYTHNVNGNLLSKVERTNRNLRPGEPDYTTSYEHNADGETTRIVLPQGNQLLFVHDRPGADRYREGNVLMLTRVADSGRGDGHGGPAANRVWTYSYEPVFNQLASAVEPRGNDPGYVPDNGGTTSPARYRSSWLYDYQEGSPSANGIGPLALEFGIVLGGTPFGLGDVNGDASTAQAAGNPVKVTAPVVHLQPGSNQAAIGGDTTQEIETRLQYNALGQCTARIDAEGNRHESEYHPETDPDGDGTPTPAPADGRTLNVTTGGYLKTQRLDTASGAGRDNGTNPTPAMVREDFAYDPAGNLTSRIDGRGIRTRWIYNQLDQVVELRRVAATADDSGPDGDPATGRGESGLVAESFKTRWSYDADDNLARLEFEDRGATRGLGPYIEASFTYDLLDNLVEVAQETTPSIDLVTQLRYDANENRIQVIKPEANRDDLAWDERDLLLSSTRGAAGPRGGTPATRFHEFDANGNLARSTDGRGGLVDYAYDGFDRLARVVDPVGSTADHFHDPASNLARVLLRGPVGGATPTNRSGATNVDLQDARYLYDELGRAFGHDQELFAPTGAMPARPPILAEGPLVPMDGFVNMRLEYDRLSRPTFVVRDSSTVTLTDNIRRDYDGAGRVVRETHPRGASYVEWTYDANHNPVEVGETENPSGTGGVPAELFLTTQFYDALDRRVMTADNLGQTSRTAYDSLDAQVFVTDPNGPPGGSIFRRSPGHETTAVAINGHGNVGRFTYDGAGRRLGSVRVLTATGRGDGTTAPVPDTSNPANPDGLITQNTAWDDNSLPAERLDDQGNRTGYAYDNLDRLVVLTADDDTTSGFSFDAEDNLTVRVDANGTSVSNVYDAAQRLISRTVTPAAGVEGTTAQTFQYDGLFRLTLATDNNVPSDTTDDVTIGFLYDSLGRVIEEGQLRSDGSPARFTDFGWLAGGLQTDLIYPAGRQIHYSYDPADRLVLVDDLDSTRPETASYQYLGLGRAHTRLYANGVRATRLDDAGTSDPGYDGVRRTRLLRHLGPSNNLLAGFEYRYDVASNRTSARRLHHLQSPPSGFRGERYGYDSADRLLSFVEGALDASHQLTSTPADQQTWALDGAGNWASFTRNAAQYLDTPNNNNEYDDPQGGGTRVDDGVPNDFLDLAATPAADGQNLTHDKNGNQTDIGSFHVLFDFRNLPVRAIRDADSLQVARYSYDALGRRVRRDVTNMGASNVTRRSHWALGRIIEDRDASDAVARQMVYGLEPGGPLWQFRAVGAVAEYYLEDALANVAALVSSASGAVTERVTYDAYGKPTFEDAASVPLTDPPGGTFRARSQFGNTELFGGMRYDFELGTRTNNVNSDLGGLYAVVGNHVDPPGSPLAWVGTQVGPPESPLGRMGTGSGNVFGNGGTDGRIILWAREAAHQGDAEGEHMLLELAFGTTRKSDSPVARVAVGVGTNPDSPLAWVSGQVGPPDRPLWDSKHRASVEQGVGTTPDSPLTWVLGHVGPPESPLDWVSGQVGPRAIGTVHGDGRSEWMTELYNPNQGRFAVRDREAGTIRFGDGRRGRAPSVGSGGNTYTFAAGNPTSDSASGACKVQP